jgi:HNH endonuclease
MDSHTERQWEGKFFKCGMRCHYCHKPLVLVPKEGYETVTKDHLTPTSRGGANTIDNIVPACFECNRRKGPMTEQEFRKAFLTAFEIIKGVRAADGNPASDPKPNLDKLDCNWEKVRRESESMHASWAWRNPA